MTSGPSSADGERLHESMVRRLYRRTVAAGQIRVPAVPGMIDEYVTMCDATFAAVGRPFTPEQLAYLRTVLQDQLTLAYSASSRSAVVISYEAQIAGPLNYHVKPEWSTVEAVYEEWLATREPPLFGTEPDARVWTLAMEAGDPGVHPVLDIGAGTGRNALALARRGHPVDAVELTPKFAEVIRAEARRQDLDVRVIARDVFDGTDDLRRDYGLIVLSEVVSDFRTAAQLRGVFELTARCLADDGRLVFNTFMPRPGYAPDAAARELGHQVYTNIVDAHELSAAASGLPLMLVADDPVYEFEKEHLPPSAWPPTGWYQEWVRGLDLFDVEPAECPIEMRWLVYRRRN
jgi:SAM-dependent methyltransferase